ncbi:MAG: GNAT family N-acetyltransferase [Rubrobacteraceae bacterium]
MKVAIRSLEENPELLPGVDKLRTLVYPDHPEAYDVGWHSSVWGWLEKHPLGDEMRRWVAATEDGDVVGHLAAVPQYYRINGERVVAHTPADYQALPGYGFHAFALMRRFFRYADNCVSSDQVEEAMAVETKLGAEPAGKLQYAAKVMDVSQLPRLPKAARPALWLPSRALRAVDGVLGRAFGGDLAVEEIESFDESFDAFFEKVADEIPCVPEKDAAFLRWRYGPGSPHERTTVLGVQGAEGLLGYAVLRVTQEADNGYLLDLTTLPGRRDAARALLRETVHRFQDAGVYIVRYRFNESSTSPTVGELRRMGFFFREGRRHTLLAKFEDRGLHKTANDIANWSYSAGDGEMTFWVR